MATMTTTVRRIHAHNLATIRAQPISELSGALGDLGTLLPLMIALSINHQISLSTTLILTGLFNVCTGLLFGLPLPVQPMKAIAAVAILKGPEGMNSGAVAAAGAFVGIAIGVLSITGLLEKVAKVVPVPVVKGIQVGAGLSLMIAAGGQALAKLSWVGPTWADNKIWIVIAGLGLLVLNIRSRTPYALIVTVMGILFSMAVSGRKNLPGLRPWHPETVTPITKEWRVGVLDAGIGQLPLTTLNSVIAVHVLAQDLLPEVVTPSVTTIGMSVAFMNLVGCWFGGMPVCHGSGGLAVQYKFGARSGASVIVLGIIKLILGLLFGESLTGLLKSFPTALLTVMVIAAGLELASVGESLNDQHRARDLKESPGSAISQEQGKRRWAVMLFTAGTLVAFKNDAVGFLAGICCHFSYQIADYLTRKQTNSHRGEHEPLLAQ